MSCSRPGKEGSGLPRRRRGACLFARNAAPASCRSCLRRRSARGASAVSAPARWRASDAASFRRTPSMKRNVVTQPTPGPADRPAAAPRRRLADGAAQSRCVWDRRASPAGQKRRRAWQKPRSGSITRAPRNRRPSACANGGAIGCKARPVPRAAVGTAFQMRPTRPIKSCAALSVAFGSMGALLRVLARPFIISGLP